MTPEEHIEKAERLLALNYDHQDQATTVVEKLRIESAAVHVRIAEYKKKYPPEAGRPIRHVDPLTRKPVKHNHGFSEDCPEDCPVQQTPMEAGRTPSEVTVRSSGRMHNHVNASFCYPYGENPCPAFGTDSTNYARPISDNPQA